MGYTFRIFDEMSCTAWWGEKKTVDEVLDEIRSDADYDFFNDVERKTIYLKHDDSSALFPIIRIIGGFSFVHKQAKDLLSEEDQRLIQEVGDICGEWLEDNGKEFPCLNEDTITQILATITAK